MNTFFAQLRNILTALAVGAMSAVVLAVPAGVGLTPAHAAEPCDAPKYIKVDEDHGSVSAAWGSLSWDGRDSAGAINKKKLNYTVNAGFRLEVCTKAGNEVDQGVDHSGLFVGPTSGFFEAQTGISHIGYRVTVLVPDEQIPTGPTCDSAGSYTLPASTAAIEWSITPTYDGPGEYLVTAALKVLESHWSDDTKLPKTWTVIVAGATGECPKTPVQVPANQTAAPPTCDSPGSYTLPDDTEQVDWSISPDYDGPDTYTVTASLKNPETHEWSDESSADKTWTVKVLEATGDCPKTPVTVPANQAASAPGCDVDGAYTLPDDTEQVDWSIDPAYEGPGTYEVTASLKNPETHEWSDETSADKTWTVDVLEATGDCPLPPPDPEPRLDVLEACAFDPQLHGDFEAGVIERHGTEAYEWDEDAEKWVLSGTIVWGDWTQLAVWDDTEYLANCQLPRPASVTVDDQMTGCDLTEFGEFDAGTIRRAGEREFAWNLTERAWELEDMADVSWADWTQAAEDVLSDEQYFEDCAAGQPAAELRQLSGTDDSCELRGTLAWTETVTTEYVWDAELRTWVLGEEGEPVREEQLREWSQEKYERLCLDVAGEEDEVQVMDHELEPEVKGVQETALPTSVDAGLGTTPFSPVGVQRNPLALVALGGGLLLLGAAARRKKATAVR